MDDAFTIPIINHKIGLDPLIGLIPGLGDIVTFGVSAIIVYSLAKHGASKKLVLKMVFNIVLDLILGGIPLLGDIWDFFFKANRKNLQLLIDYHQTKDEVPEQI